MTHTSAHHCYTLRPEDVCTPKRVKPESNDENKQDDEPKQRNGKANSAEPSIEGPKRKRGKKTEFESS